MKNCTKSRVIVFTMIIGCWFLPEPINALSNDSNIPQDNDISLSDKFIDADDKLKLYFAYAEYKMGNYAVARNMWLHTVGSGKAEALFNLGNLYDIGQGVEQDVELATQYYRDSATLGSRNSAYQLGLMHQRHPELVTLSEATDWLLNAAQDGDEDARSLLVTLVDQQSPSKLQRIQLDIAKGSYESALNALLELIDDAQPDAKAFTQLGWIYEKGLGVTKNMDLAGEYFLQAAERGDQEAMYSVAVMHQTGVGLTQNNQASQKWLKKAAALGFQQAQNQLNQ